MRVDNLQPRKQPFWVGLVTLFPPMFDALTHGVSGRALQKGLLSLDISNPRDFAHDSRRTVDDRPYGGGPGMLMKVEPLRDAISALKERAPAACRTVYLSPQGKTLTQQALPSLLSAPLLLVAGRYEGIDQRIIDEHIDDAWSIGDYVLSGGELPAMVLIDALARLLPGALGNGESAAQDSFSEGLLDHPHYTRPEEIDGKKVPSILLGGNHGEIARWRMKQSLGKTWRQRPELLHDLSLTQEQQLLLEAFISEHNADNSSYE